MAEDRKKTEKQYYTGKEVIDLEPTDADADWIRTARDQRKSEKKSGSEKKRQF